MTRMEIVALWFSLETIVLVNAENHHENFGGKFLNTRWEPAHKELHDGVTSLCPNGHVVYRLYVGTNCLGRSLFKPAVPRESEDA